MTGTLGQLLDQRSSRLFVGRAKEMASLLRMVEGEGPLVVFVNGIGGVGKTTLLDAFARAARERGATVLQLDCRSIEPTEKGFLAVLGEAVGAAAASLVEVNGRLGTMPNKVVLALDAFEVFRLLDPWLRQSFLPALPGNARVVLAGREAPAGWWRALPGSGETFLNIQLGNLPDDDAEELLRRAGVSVESGQRINRLARGHPLALMVAASARADPVTTEPEGAAVHRVVEEFTVRYLADLDVGTRVALDAASVARRATVSLLGAMLPGRAPQDSFDRLRALPFVAVAPDGLVLHETIQEVTAAALHAADPARYFAYRRAAWRQLRSEVDTVPTRDLWRYTADMLYLIENPVVREAFFPSTSHSLTTEPALREDWPAIEAIIRKHEPPEAAAQLAKLWARLPGSFSVVRDELGTIAAFYCLFELERASQSWLDEDPIVAACWRHLRQRTVPIGQRTLFLRRWLTLDTGEGPSPGQAACWLDVKRVYMEMRPALGRIYMPIRDLTPYAAVAPRLGFETWEGGTVPIGGQVYQLVMLNFGAASVDGWLARLVAAELGVSDEEVLDDSARQLSIDGNRIDLTRLEYELLSTLRQRHGRFVSKEVLFNSVWPSDSRAGSNVVEVVIRSLRKKLGRHASLIETKRGLGYRLRAANRS